MTNKNFKDFEFIIEEIIRFRKKMTAEGIKNIPESEKWDYLCSLDHPMHGSVIIGRKADKRLHDLVRRTLKNTPNLVERTNVEALNKAIRYIFCEEILTKKSELTPSLADKIIARALKHVRTKKLETRIYYLPCVLPPDSENQEFSIGLVKFVQTSAFLAEHKDKFDAFTGRVRERWLAEVAKKHAPVEKAEEERINKDCQMFERDLVEHYKKFPWIAAIQIKNFEEERGEEVAELCVQTALNILRLFFPYGHDERICIGSRQPNTEKSAKLSQDGDGKFEIELRGGRKILEENGWVKTFIYGRDEEWIVCAGSLIQFLSSGHTVPLLYQRLMNAFWWYAEALSNEFPYIRAISLSNALEAFLSTADGNPDISIVNQIAFRANLLLSIEEPDGDWEKKIKDFYDLRSGLVHGRIPAFDRKVAEQIGIGLKIVKRTLLEAIWWSHYMAHNGCINDLKAIDDKFANDLEKYCKGEMPGYNFFKKEEEKA